MTKDLIFFDVECYSHNAFVVFKNAQKEVVAVFRNEHKFFGLRQFVKDYILVGYNNYFYDDFMVEAMINGWNAQQLKALNDDIIGNPKKKRYPKGLFQSLDAFQQIDVGMPGLKKIQANMSKRIHESSVGFNIGRELTPEEWKSEFEYCSNDIDTTIDVFNMRIKSYFNPKEQLVKLNGGKGERWNTTTLSANALLKGSTLPKWSDIRLNGEDFTDLSMLTYVPQEVVDLWNSGKDKGKVTIDDYGCSIEFGFGGLHGVNKSGKRFKGVKLLDVASMYPHIIILINALGNATKDYKAILEERIRIKHIDKEKQEALKLILNSVYGLLKNQYSALYNPKSALSVCIYGQIALYMLGKMLSPVATIVQLNTDGVAFVPHGDYKHIWEDWQDLFKLTLEEESYDELIQKDVNNYIGIKDGKVVKCKGGQTSRYQYDQFFKNNSMRIVDIALVDHLAYGKSVIDTMLENLDKPELFQIILQAGGTFKGTFDEDGNQYQKINRVFATKKGTTLYKKRMDDGLVKFADAPDNMYIHNDDVKTLQNFSRIVDLNHYIDIVNKRLDGWV